MAAKKTGRFFPKSVVLYDKRRIQPETLNRIAAARDGEMIAVEAVELAAFLPLVIFVPETEAG